MAVTEIGDELLEFSEGIDVPCTLKMPNEPPEWLDKQMYDEGRKFFLANSVSVLVCNFRNLVIGLCVPNLCDALVLTERSETVKKARWRYIDTSYYMTQWYRGPAPWENASYWNMVNTYHKQAANKLCEMTKEQRSSRAQEVVENLNPDEKMQINDLDKALLNNLRHIRENGIQTFPVYERYMKSHLLFSQFDMALVQMAFFASIIVFPRQFGADGCSDKSITSFLHFWRVMGYYLGVEDRFNVAKGRLEETRNLLRQIGEQLVIPSMLHLNEISVHMAKCVCQGYGVDYPLIVYSHCYAHGLELKQLWAHFTWWQKMTYWWRRFFVEWLYSIPIVRKLLNVIILKGLDKIFTRRKSNIVQNEHTLLKKSD